MMTDSTMSKDDARDLARCVKSECPGAFVTLVPWSAQTWTLQVAYNDEALWVHSPQMWERTKEHYRDERARYQDHADNTASG